MTPLTVEVTYRAVFHHMHKEHIEQLIAVGSRGKARRHPKPGRVVNECDAEPNPALHLFPIRGHRVLAKLDRGLSSQNEWLHIEFVVFIWAHQITQIFLRCAGCNHFMDVFVGGFTATKSRPVGTAVIALAAGLGHELIHCLFVFDEILTHILQIAEV